MRLYEGDIEPARLKSQLEILTAEFQSQQFSEEGTVNKFPVTFSKVKDYLISLRHGRVLSSEVVTILRLILVMPATNATSKRSFSAFED